MKQLRLLVGAYAFSPTVGSEFAQGWNYVRGISRHCEVTVLVGSSDGRMGDLSLLDTIHAADLPGVTVVAVRPDWFCLLIKFLDVRLGFSWLFVLGLRRWHGLALRKAKLLHQERAFDVVHQLGPVGFRNPGFLFRLGVPSYWGPVGGFQYINLRLAFHSSLRYGIISLVRNLSTYLSARSRSVRRAVEGFGAFSFATSTNQENFRVLSGIQGPVCSDQAVEVSTGARAKDASPQKPAVPPLQVAWCGSVDGRKNIRLLVDVARRLAGRPVPIQITVIGDGPMLGAMRSECANLGNIVFVGRVPRPEVRQLLRASHVLCFTSLSEANTSTLFEGMEAQCIPLTLDLDGFSSTVTPDIGFRINPSQPVEGIVLGYVEVLERLTSCPALVDQMQKQLACRLAELNWDALVDKHWQILQRIAGRH